MILRVGWKKEVQKFNSGARGKGRDEECVYLPQDQAEAVPTTWNLFAFDNLLLLPQAPCPALLQILPGALGWLLSVSRLLFSFT